MVSIYCRKRTLAAKTVYQNGLIYTSFDLPLFSLDSTFKVICMLILFTILGYKLVVSYRLCKFVCLFSYLYIKKTFQDHKIMLSANFLYSLWPDGVASSLKIDKKLMSYTVHFTCITNYNEHERPTLALGLKLMVRL
jgi:hypothetical protein